MSYNRRSTILDLKAEGVLKLWHDYRLGHTLDLSGNSNHGVLTPIINQPFSRQGLTVPLGGKGLTTPSIDLTSTDNVTVVFGARQIKTSSNQIFIEFSTNFNSVTTGFVSYQNSTNQLQIAVKGDVSSPTLLLPIQDILGDGQYNYIGLDYDKSLAVGAVKGYGNGVLSGTSGAGANTNNFGNHSLFIGARNMTSLPVNAVLQGIILVSRVLTAAEHLSVYKELAYP